MNHKTLHPLHNVRRAVHISLMVLTAAALTACGTARKSLSDEKTTTITLPQVEDDAQYYRSFQTYSSSDLTVARTSARTLCKGELAGKLKSTVLGGNSVYLRSTTTNGEEEVVNLSEAEYSTLVDAVMEGAEVEEERVERSASGRFTVYLTMRVKRSSVADLAADRERFVEYLRSRGK